MKILFIIITAIAITSLAACSKDGGSKETSGKNHTYHITVEGGETFKGEVSKPANGVSYFPYAPVDMVVGEKSLAIHLRDDGKFQVGGAFHLDSDNQPLKTSNSIGLFFKKWPVSEKGFTTKEDQFTLSLENYKEHTIKVAGHDVTCASFVLHFEGTFINLDTDETVSASGKVVIVAP